jgi:hypothetical protein
MQRKTVFGLLLAVAVGLAGYFAAATLERALGAHRCDHEHGTCARGWDR